MNYNFDEERNLRTADSLKWNAAKEEVLPMWVAEMDFRLPDFIQNALTERISEGSFGYFQLPQDFFSVIQFWQKKRHQIYVDQDFILPVPGVMASVSAIIEAFTEKGDQIIIQPPVYNHFFNTIKSSERKIVENNLILNKNRYQIDFNDLKEKAAKPETKILLLCNPQNPVGRVWSREELEETAEICAENNILVISDEIHADLAFEKYTPFFDVAKDSAVQFFTVHSPCKAFNFPGLPVGYVISTDFSGLKNIEKTLESREQISVNALSVVALKSAYTFGENWLDEVKIYIQKNYFYLKEFIQKNIPQIEVLPLEATYLLWLDCRKLNVNSDKIAQQLLENHQLLINSGLMYGEAGDGFLRINIACTEKNLRSGLERLRDFVLNIS